MNFIYDITLNFNKIFYDFYEWNNKDKFMYIKKIPFIKVNSNTFKDLITYKIKLNNDIFNLFKDKTTINNRLQKQSCLIITDTKNTLAIKFNNCGKSIMYSSVSLKDEYNLLYSSKKLKETKLTYTKMEKNNYILETRNEYTQKNFLLKNIYNISFDTLKYIYYECFGQEENNHSIMLKKLTAEISNNNFKLNNKIYNILKPISTN